MTLIHRTLVTLDDALGFLSARTFSPSTMGMQLEAVRDNALVRPKTSRVGGKRTRKAKVTAKEGVCGVCSDPIAVGNVVVASRGVKVHLRCFGESAAPLEEGMYVKAQPPDGCKARDVAEARLPRDAGIVRCLDALAGQDVISGLKKTTPNLARLHRLMKENESTRTQGELVVQCLRAYEERKLRSKEHALASVYLWANARDAELYPSVEHDEDTLAQAFRTNKAVKARQRASDLYADCYLALSAWIVTWNRKDIRVVA